MQKIKCSGCDSIEEPVISVRGNSQLELILWISFIIPGALYSLWRFSTRKHVCRDCGSKLDA